VGGSTTKCTPTGKNVPLPENQKTSPSIERIFTLHWKSTDCMNTFPVAQNSFVLNQLVGGYSKLNVNIKL